MSARSEEGPAAAGCCLIVLLAGYLILGSLVFVAAYGEPQGVTLTLFLVVVLWPLALIWWSLPWIVLGIVLVLASMQAKRMSDGL